MPGRSMLKNGVPLAFGSDYPVESPDPFAGWAAAFTRQDANGQPFGGWRAEESGDARTGVVGLHQGAAYAGFAEDQFGRLAPGQRADFIIVDRDPLLACPSDLRATQGRADLGRRAEGVVARERQDAAERRRVATAVPSGRRLSASVFARCRGTA